MNLCLSSTRIRAPSFTGLLHLYKIHNRNRITTALHSPTSFPISFKILLKQAINNLRCIKFYRSRMISNDTKYNKFLGKWRITKFNQWYLFEFFFDSSLSRTRLYLSSKFHEAIYYLLPENYSSFRGMHGSLHRLYTIINIPLEPISSIFHQEKKKQQRYIVARNRQWQISVITRQ